jgi:NarL family two-component system response regulator LiaR
MMSTRPIRILIVDDHTLIREGLRAMISLQPELLLAGEAVDGLTAVALSLALEPDVILMDLVLPGLDGLGATAEIKRQLPQARILILTGSANDDQLLPALKAGALGYLQKDAPYEQLLQAIHEVAHGRPFLSSAVALKALTGQETPPTNTLLTEREIETLCLLAQGLTNDQIAWRLCVSANTVARHINSILAKLELTNRTQAALYALRHGIASLEPV